MGQVLTKQQLLQNRVENIYPNENKEITANKTGTFLDNFVESIYDYVDNTSSDLGCLSIWDNTKFGRQTINNYVNFDDEGEIGIRSNSHLRVDLNVGSTVKVPSTYTVAASVDLTDKKYVDCATSALSATLSIHTSNSTIHRPLCDTLAGTTNLWSGSKINTELANKAGVTEFDNHVNTANIHRVQCDATISTTQLWSSQKIYDELYLKADSSCLTNLVTTDTFQSISGSKIFSNSISFTGAVSVPTPTATTHAVRKSYVDNNFVTLSTAQSISGVKTFTGNINLNNSVTMPFRGTEGTDRIYQSLQGVNANNATNEDSGAFIQFRTSTANGYGAQIGGHRLSGGNSKLVVKTGGLSVTPTMSVDNNGNLRASGDVIAYSNNI